jgi:hypothetical protein
MEREELIEKLAAMEHGSWSHWMKYLFSKCSENPDDGSMTIPPDLAARWQRQADTSYADLSEREKQSDRNRVNLILPIIEEYKRTSPIEENANGNREQRDSGSS